MKWENRDSASDRVNLEGLAEEAAKVMTQHGLKALPTSWCGPFDTPRVLVWIRANPDFLAVRVHKTEGRRRFGLGVLIHREDIEEGERTLAQCVTIAAAYLASQGLQLVAENEETPLVPFREVIAQCLP